MDKKEILQTIQEVRKDSKKRNFKQTFDLIVNFKGLDLKKPEHNINLFLQLPYSKGRQNKVGIFIDKELLNKSKGIFDEIVNESDLASLGKDKKAIKKLAKKVDFFVAQANIMSKVAVSLGKTLGPMGKMPNPKAGCVVQPSITDLKPICNTLRNTIRLQTKNEPCVKVSVGKEDSKDDEIAENILAVYNNLVRVLPQEKHSIKNIFIKLTMGKSFSVGEKEEAKPTEVKKVLVNKKETKIKTEEIKKEAPKKAEKPKETEKKEAVKKVKPVKGKKENGKKV